MTPETPITPANEVVPSIVDELAEQAYQAIKDELDKLAPLAMAHEILAHSAVSSVLKEEAPMYLVASKLVAVEQQLQTRAFLPKLVELGTAFSDAIQAAQQVEQAPCAPVYRHVGNGVYRRS